MDTSCLKIKEITAKSYITPSKMPGADYVINPYVGCPHQCIYCYAEFMKRFSHHDEPWGTFVDVKIHSTATRPVPLLNKNIFLSSITDCYNPLEAKYQLTRKLLQQLRPTGAHITILTKSALVLRDLDILTTLSDVSVGFSMNTTNDEFRQDIEPGASSVQDRLHALKILHKNGVRTYVHMSPIFPGLTDWKELLEQIIPHIEYVSFENLKLRTSSLQRIMCFISQKHPDLRTLYYQIYQENDMFYWRDLREKISAFCKQRNIPATVHFTEREENQNKE